MSNTKEYKTFPDLKQDSTIVALVTAQAGQQVVPADAAGVGPIPATISTVRVDKVLAGRSTGATEVAIRQLGTGHEGGDVANILLPGRQYLLFLSAFEFTKGQPTGQFTITGDAGAYIMGGDGQLSRIAPFANKLPQSITVQDVVKLITS